MTRLTKARVVTYVQTDWEQRAVEACWDRLARQRRTVNEYTVLGTLNDIARDGRYSLQVSEAAADLHRRIATDRWIEREST